MSDALQAAFSAAACDELRAAAERIAHCVDQMTEEQVWARPPAGLNAVGNLLLHLTGNVTQMIVSAVGGAPDLRDRPAEFAARGTAPKAELVVGLQAAVAAACDVVARASAAELCRPRPFRDSEWSGVLLVVRCLAHLRGHAQEVIHMTREMLGDGYRYAGPR